MPATAADRSLCYLALLTLGVLLIAAAVWYPERMLFADPAFIAFEVINSGSVVISEHRFAAAVTQVIPLLTSRVGVGLEGVLLAYSVSFYFLYLGVAATVGLVWRQYGLATLLAVYFTLLVSDGYYWPNNEVHQGVAWAVLFLGRYDYLRESGRSFRWYDHLLLLISLALATNAHLLVAAPLSFLWVYRAVQQRRWVGLGSLSWWLYGSLLLAGIALRYYLSHDSWYDGYKLRGVQSLSWEGAMNSLSSPQARAMYRRVGTHYLTLPVVFLLGLVAALRRGHWWSPLLTVCAMLVYTVLISVTYPDGFGRELLYYFESEWAGLGLIAATPLVWHLRGLGRLGWIGLAIGGLLFLPRLWAIGGSHAYFTARLDNLHTTVAYLRELPGSKFATADGQLLTDYLGVHWGLPIESVLAGSIPGSAATTVTLAGPSNPELDTTDPNVFHSNFRHQPIGQLNEQYFHLDTTTRYRVLTVPELAEWTRRMHRLPP